MRFDRMELKHFRSFGEEVTHVHFPRGENLLALVGANNAGKTNVLDPYVSCSAARDASRRILPTSISSICPRNCGSTCICANH
jgi:predicted ATP-dependent endonuclease of OLD family